MAEELSDAITTSRQNSLISLISIHPCQQPGAKFYTTDWLRDSVI